MNRGSSGLNWRHGLHLYQVEIEGRPPRRDKVLTMLRSRRIGAAVHYLGVNNHPYYAKRFPEPFPNSDWATGSLLTLPLHLHLAEPHIRRVVGELANALTETRS
jgi:dTDP-4-amino-4,6-dideoxygalactose transaminase